MIPLDLDTKVTTEAPADEKARLINEILELNSTLGDLTRKMVETKEDTERLREENQVLSKYVANLMQQSKTFQPADM